MFLYSALLTLTVIFITLTCTFLSLGLYYSDSTFIIISILFGMASTLCRLEMKELSLNPFID